LTEVLVVETLAIAALVEAFAFDTCTDDEESDALADGVEVLDLLWAAVAASETFFGLGAAGDGDGILARPALPLPFCDSWTEDTAAAGVDDVGEVSDLFSPAVASVGLSDGSAACIAVSVALVSEAVVSTFAS
jgi:hypothetical protein